MVSVDGGTIFVKIAGEDQNLSSLLTKLQSEMISTNAATSQFSSGLASLDSKTKQSQAEMLAYAQAVAKVEVAAGNTARANLTLAEAIAKTGTGSVAGVRAMGQLQAQLNAEAAAATRAANEQAAAAAKGAGANKSFIDSIGGWPAFIAAGYAVRQVTGAIMEMVDSGNQLEKTTAMVRALSGSQDKFNSVMSVAKEQQKLYGGSLNDTLESLSGLIYTSNQAGVSVEKLTNIARRLAIVDPVNLCRIQIAQKR
jgi:hypothetical protein